MIRRPVVVILGSTGTGKTKLSLEIAKRYGGEVISADSMQVYSNLDVVTAKATRDEQTQVHNINFKELAEILILNLLQIKHHLLDVAQPGLLYSVRQFQNSALPIIDNLLANQKVPIIVGGTNYYIESILWKILIDEWKDTRSDNDDDEDTEAVTPSKRMKPMTEERVFDQFEMNDQGSEELHEKLRLVDPETAAQLHPNNKRKIIRALEVYERSGKRFSSFIKDQQAASGGSTLGGPLRYDNLIIFWLCCEQETLNQRLDSRVDDMVKQGLITEIRQFHEQFVRPYGEEVDYTKGILQTIGFKEFLPYLTTYGHEEDAILEDYFRGTVVEPPTSLATLNACLDELKLVTRRYSKKQIKWVKNRFLKAAQKNRTIPPIYKLDTTFPNEWTKWVSDPAQNVIDHYQDPTVELTTQPETPAENEQAFADSKKSHFCELCQRVFIGEFQWDIHVKSRKHKKVQDRLRKLEQIMALGKAKEEIVAVET